MWCSWCTNQCQGAIAFQQRKVGIEVMSCGYCIDDQIKALGMRSHFFGITR